MGFYIDIDIEHNIGFYTDSDIVKIFKSYVVICASNNTNTVLVHTDNRLTNINIHIRCDNAYDDGCYICYS